MLPDTGERYLTTPLFADIPADMTAEEVAILQSTATFAEKPAAVPAAALPWTAPDALAYPRPCSSPERYASTCRSNLTGDSFGEQPPSTDRRAMLLKHLQYLTALARERHFARRGERCAVTQPTLSAGIKQLEDQLGLLVVKRGHRFVGLTAEGERVLVWAQRSPETPRAWNRRPAGCARCSSAGCGSASCPRRSRRFPSSPRRWPLDFRA